MKPRRPRYELGETNGQPYLECFTCHRKTYNRADIQYRFCGFCHLYLEGILADAAAQRNPRKTLQE